MSFMVDVILLSNAAPLSKANEGVSGYVLLGKRTQGTTLASCRRSRAAF
jgi:hypothetical protein